MWSNWFIVFQKILLIEIISVVCIVTSTSVIRESIFPQISMNNQALPDINGTQILDPAVEYEFQCVHQERIWWFFRNRYNVIETVTSPAAAEEILSEHGTISFKSSFKKKGMRRDDVGLYTCQEVDPDEPLCPTGKGYSSVYLYMNITGNETDTIFHETMRAYFPFYPGQELWIPCKPLHPGVTTELVETNDDIILQDYRPSRGFRIQSCLDSDYGYADFVCTEALDDLKRQWHGMCEVHEPVEPVLTIEVSSDIQNVNRSNTSVGAPLVRVTTKSTFTRSEVDGIIQETISNDRGREHAEPAIKVGFKTEIAVKRVIRIGSKVVINCTRQSTHQKDENEEFLRVLHYTDKSGKKMVASERLSATVVINNVTEEGFVECWSRLNDCTDDYPPLIIHLVPREYVLPKWKVDAPSDILLLHQTEGDRGMTLPCHTLGYPPANITIIKDGRVISDLGGSGDELGAFDYLHVNDSGDYTCMATNSEGSVSRIVRLKVSSSTLKLAVAVVILTILLVFFVICLISWNTRRQILARKKYLELVRLGNENMLDSNRSPLEQAENLPYNMSYIIKKEDLTFECQIGMGAFGRVYRAKARGVCPNEDQTVVAVKTIKTSGVSEQQIAFDAEVKTLMYIGRHTNIINLIGVCIEDFSTKGEMSMVVEYCQNSSLHEYITKESKALASILLGEQEEHQLLLQETNRREEAVNLLYQGQFGAQEVKYLNMSKTSNSNNTSVPSVMVSRSTGDSSSPLTDASIQKEVTLENSATLLDWAHQIANGMYFLSSKKIVHGDLAARNVLLADNNVIKIADFGLAKDLYAYNSNIYHFKSGRAVPQRWAAVETLTRRELSSNSDVWSYAVMLWEIFTLGRVPYYWLNNDQIIKSVEGGTRLPKPKYAHPDVFQLMQDCWREDPMSRPTFEQLEYRTNELQRRALFLEDLPMLSCYKSTSSSYLPMGNLADANLTTCTYLTQLSDSSNESNDRSDEPKTAPLPTPTGAPAQEKVAYINI